MIIRVRIAIPAVKREGRLIPMEIASFTTVMFGDISESLPFNLWIARRESSRGVYEKLESKLLISVHPLFAKKID
jgi:hypothetical protein